MINGMMSTTILNAFENGKEILVENVTDTGRPTGIVNFIIGKVGRYVTHYRGDILYDMDRLFNTIKHMYIDNTTVILTIALRECGVDNNEFFTARLQYHVDNGMADMSETYRKIYMLRVSKKEDELLVKVELREVSLVVEYSEMEGV